MLSICSCNFSPFVLIWNFLFILFSHFFIGLWIPWKFSFLRSVYYSFGKNFHPFSVMLYFQSSDWFLCCAEAFDLVQSHLPTVGLIFELLEFYLENHCLFLYVPYINIFDHFKLTLVQGEKQGSSFSLLLADILFSQQYLWKMSFLHELFLAPWSKLRLQ
jgi:hypothetical protein